MCVGFWFKATSSSTRHSLKRSAWPLWKEPAVDCRFAAVSVPPAINHVKFHCDGVSCCLTDLSLIHKVNDMKSGSSDSRCQDFLISL